MEVHSDFVESSKSALSFENINYYKAEDSGYHTSFTPGSLEHSDLSSDFLDQSLPPRRNYIDVTPDLNIRLTRRFGPLKQKNDYPTDTPPPRRAIKRPYPTDESTKPLTNIPTPTTLIAGKIESLEVNEDKENSTSAITVDNSSQHTAKSRVRCFYRLKVPEQILPYPITPVKRNCRLSPCRSAKKLDFADFSIHSLSCKQHELQPVPEELPKVHLIQPILARPNQKIDILSLLHNTCAIPALKSILQYLSYEDSHNFCLVSASWSQIWNLYSSKEKKQGIKQYLKSVKENQENCAKNSITQVKNSKLYGGCLREIHNEIKNQLASVSSNTSNLTSPPCSPKSNRFRKFTKSASLDSRLQLSCARCSQPAKVTEESNGEEWVECTSATCAYQFCRSCRCSRHPGKTCFQYDLNAPSPSKRKKCEYAVGTTKSRKNLRRLL